MARPCRCVCGALPKPDARRPPLPHQPSPVRAAPGLCLGPASPPPPLLFALSGPPRASLGAGCPRGRAAGCRRPERQPRAPPRGGAAAVHASASAAATARRRPVLLEVLLPPLGLSLDGLLPSCGCLLSIFLHQVRLTKQHKRWSTVEDARPTNLQKQPSDRQKKRLGNVVVVFRPAARADWSVSSFHTPMSTKAGRGLGD